jgi:hypothetical protein
MKVTSSIPLSLNQRPPSMNDTYSKFVQQPLLAWMVLSVICGSVYAGDNRPPSGAREDDGLAAIINPFNSTCYDWRGHVIPCEFKRPYTELLSDKPVPAPRFLDNANGTISDTLTGLVWLKNLNCFGMTDWKSADLAVKALQNGDCGPDPALVLSDGSSAGDWRLPTMGELCTLIDFSRREPALPEDHVFDNVPQGYHWSATALDHYPGMAWIVYLESGTTCYENKQHHSGHIWPVRGPVK